jgi:cytochrome oxidase Cu insertion factor (SCO1/SenC/PrrC family)
MTQPARRIESLVWTGLALITVTVLLALLFATVKLQRALAKPLPIYGSVAQFTLTNQNGQAVSLADLRGHVWVADLIFTRCAGPCLKMSRQMKELQQSLPAQSTARLVTLTTDPEFDTPAVLKTYSARFDADLSRWMFLTGTRTQLTNVACGSLKLTTVEKSPEDRSSPADLFLHSTLFVIVDQSGRLRGVFETTGEGVEPAQVQRKLLLAIRRLEREKP